MDKILKFFKKLWLFKERIVLVMLLGFLGYNVYKIFVPNDVEPVLPTRPGEVPVAKLPEPRMVDVPGSYRTLTQRNPFSYYSDAEIDPRGGLTGEEAGIKLLDIKEGAPGKWRARLKTKSSKWYDEGDSFEEFELQNIDPVGQTATVFAERFGKTVVLSVEK